MIELPNTTYVIVGRCLSSTLGEEPRKNLTEMMSHGDIRWERLLGEANRQQCTPLWYVRLREHGLLHLLPKNLQTYLAELTAVNRKRNRILRKELANILNNFSDNSIPSILLNSTASIGDRLYEDEGARLIGAMDLLVPPEQAREAERLLMMEGYVDQPAQKKFDRLQGRIPTLYHIRKSTAVNLHYALNEGFAGSALNTEAAWRENIPGEITGHPMGRLSPPQRLLYNALDAALPQGRFICGHLKLADLAEFSALLKRYWNAVDWARFWRQVQRHEFSTAVIVYANLASNLTGADIDPPVRPQTRWHLRRIAASLPVSAGSLSKHWQASYWRLGARVYHIAKFPVWTWQYTCSRRRETSKVNRLACFAKQILDPHFLKNAFNPQAL